MKKKRANETSEWPVWSHLRPVWVILSIYNELLPERLRVRGSYLVYGKALPEEYTGMLNVWIKVRWHGKKCAEVQKVRGGVKKCVAKCTNRNFTRKWILQLISALKRTHHGGLGWKLTKLRKKRANETSEWPIWGHLRPFWVILSIQNELLPERLRVRGSYLVYGMPCPANTQERSTGTQNK